MGIKHDINEVRRIAQARIDQIRDRLESVEHRRDRQVAAIKRAYNAHHLSDAGVRFIASKEGYRAHAYQDSGGIWTIGYGHTPAHPGQVVTREQALKLLASDVSWAVDGALANTIRKLNQNELNALTSLVFNIGVGGFQSSTVRDRINGNESDDRICEAWKWWNKDANGNVLEGLVIRRAEECRIWRKGV